MLLYCQCQLVCLITSFHLYYCLTYAQSHAGYNRNQYKIAFSAMPFTFFHIFYTYQNTAPEWFKNQAAGAVVVILNLKTREFKLPESIKKMRNLRVLILTDYGVEYQTEFTNPGLFTSLGKLRRIKLQQVSLSYPCKLKNVHKLCLYMCKVREAFENNSMEFSKAMPTLVELNIDYCKDLVGLPVGFCNIATLKKLSICSCPKFFELPQEIGKLEKLELLRISHFAEFKEMPE
ncbi:putative disease resistance protein At5g47280 isoform X1 [Prosopis cineraria]|uniref:putative disease resistance protein At5g47280 isoform X1 n=1 Tax=Prosopis cineraria TaxID=364024 RepID=UPI00240ECF32|nr:putative disease resistance protein At5g47280 isoform X1 [Prosopis cineraria]